MTADDEHRLVIAVTVIRILTGGLTRTIDWVLIARLFPHLTRGHLIRKWGPIAAKYRPYMDEMQAHFQKAFIDAYKKKEVSTIDYDNLEAYDWAQLVDWAEERIDINK